MKHLLWLLMVVWLGLPANAQSQRTFWLGADISGTTRRWRSA